MALVDTFVGSRRRDRLARTLVRLAMEVDGVDGAAVVEVSEDNRPEVVAFSDEDVRHLTDLQITGRSGPAFDAADAGRSALLEQRGGDPRWAVLSPLAEELELTYAYAIPLIRRRKTLGGLVLYGRSSPDVDRLDARLETLTAVAAVGLLQARMHRAVDERVEQLERALVHRAIIEQAKGVLLAQGHADPEAAFEALRGHARRHRVKLDEVAREVVKGASGAKQALVLPRQRGDEGEANSTGAEGTRPNSSHGRRP